MSQCALFVLTLSDGITDTVFRDESSHSPIDRCCGVEVVMTVFFGKLSTDNNITAVFTATVAEFLHCLICLCIELQTNKQMILRKIALLISTICM